MSLDLILRPLLLAIHATDIISAHLTTLLTHSTAEPAIRGEVPKHVAFSVVGGDEPEKVVREVVEWAGERGVGEVSLWSEDRLFDTYPIPLTPDANLPSAAPDEQDQPTTLQSPDTESLDRDWVQVRSTSSSGTPSPTLNTPTKSPTSRLQARQPRSKHTYTVFPSLDEINSHHPRRPVTVHLLPRALEGGTVLARITRDLLSEGVRSEEVTQEMLDVRIRDHLNFQSDPCLLIIQPLLSTHPIPLTYRALRTILPADAPSVHGYPFWVLRITEIFQAPPIRVGVDAVEGWDRAVRRWQGVEQRLGK